MSNDTGLVRLSSARLSMRFAACAVTALALAAAPAALQAQTGAARPATAAASGPSDKDTRPYDKHDFRGLWARNPLPFHEPACPECRDNGPVAYGFFGDVPPLTAEGQKRFEKNLPSKGWEAGSPEALAHPNSNVAYRRAVAPGLGNDPEERCEPLGAMRLVVFSGGNAAMHIVQDKELIVQRFEWTWDNREIWTDGRALPKVDDYLPRFNGYSVGKWEGDTLVVKTVGLDDRQWVDAFGFPISDQAVLEERYSRPSRNRLRVDLTLTDPAMYTRPWHSSTKVWALISKEAMTLAGWSGIVEDRCVPSDQGALREIEEKAIGKKK